MSTRRRTTLHPIKSHENVEVVQRSKIMESDKPTTSRQMCTSERKLALQQDVDKLKKKLRHEENIHRALERAFTRPLGTLPRLPSYLPPQTLELLAEVAVLEEEVVRLEEQVVLVRQGLYQEAVNISSSRSNNDTSTDLYDPHSIDCSKTDDHEIMAKSDTTLMVSAKSNINEELPGKDNWLCVNSTKNEPQATRSPPVKTPVRKRSIENRRVHERINFQKSKEESKSRDNSPNILSEDLLKCLMTILSRMRRMKSKSVDGQQCYLSSLSASHSQNSGIQDPYGILSERKTDIGQYKNLCSVDANSINQIRRANSSFLLRRLKILLAKLASVELQGLTHQEKLAFWINIYNACMMTAFVEQGNPYSAETVVALMQTATINVGGNMLNAIAIEHRILRLPYHSKYNLLKGVRKDEKSAQSISGLELSEPLVTFALSCGSWSSPAVRIYTAAQVENEIETAKRDYL